MKFTLGLIAGAFVIVFIIQNTQVVEISFLFWEISISRALMVFFIFVIGAMVGGIMVSFKKKKSTTTSMTNREKS